MLYKADRAMGYDSISRGMSMGQRSLIERSQGEIIFNSPFPEMSFPSLTFAEFIFQHLDEHKDKTLMVDYTTGQEFKSCRIKELSVRVASGLTRLGLRKGDTVLIICTNSPLFTVFTLACAALGLWCISIGGPADGCVPFHVLQEDDGKAFPVNLDIHPDKDILFLPYSSGTTGLPKGVMLTHQTVITNLLQLINGPMALDSDRECLLGLIPFYHIYGLSIIQFGSVCLGTKLVTLPSLDPQTLLGAIQKHKVSYMHLTPPVVLFLAKSPLVQDYDVTSVKRILCVYGMTEASPATHHDVAPPRVGTVGQLMPNTRSKVISVESGECLGPGEKGEILIKGPQLMKGYLNNQSATYDTIRDGWLHTGDIGHYDDDGYLTVSDRLKELIKCRGFQVIHLLEGLDGINFVV
ncbi:probable 4-coumarate--CoA ligase 1 [Pecten maximus]|uniref:probable 4-coumarate--CoA ligase 1 n=1 Tax=Pecten maximus TaxID=6579 RepID=UPI001458BD51|nr:probable 4-coumarate--CoA ligase 1 [Pecten maximus]